MEGWDDSPYDNCYKFENGNWVLMEHTLQNRRRAHGVFNLQNGLMMIGGLSNGIERYHSPKMVVSSELVNLDNVEIVESDPVETSYFCAIKVNDTFLAITGGTKGDTG